MSRQSLVGGKRRLQPSFRQSAPAFEPLSPEQITEKVAGIPTDSLGAVGDANTKNIVQLSEAFRRTPIDRKVHVIAWLVIVRASERLDQLGHILVLVEGSAASHQKD